MMNEQYGKLDKKINWKIILYVFLHISNDIFYITIMYHYTFWIRYTVLIFRLNLKM